MTIDGLLATIEGWRFAATIRESLYLFPAIESIHVLALTMVFGTIVIVDLRLLGGASMRRPFAYVVGDTLKWTWVAFAVTVVTGLLMFSTNARVYFHNLYFELKMAAIALSGINMAIFELTTGRSLAGLDQAPTPRSARMAAVLSLCLWISVIFLGRWIGFTTTHTTATPDSEINIEDLLPK